MRRRSQSNIKTLLAFFLSLFGLLLCFNLTVVTPTEISSCQILLPVTLLPHVVGDGLPTSLWQTALFQEDDRTDNLEDREQDDWVANGLGSSLSIFPRPLQSTVFERTPSVDCPQATFERGPPHRSKSLLT